MARGMNKRLVFYKKLLEKLHGTHGPGTREFYSAWSGLHDEDSSHYLGAPGGAMPKALEYFGLDVSQPWDWMVLLSVLSEVLFGELPRGRKEGAGKFWDHRAYLALADLYYEIGIEVEADDELGPLAKRKFTNTKIAELISRTPEFDQYRNSPGELRKRLPEALRQYEKWLDDIRDDAVATASDPEPAPEPEDGEIEGILREIHEHWPLKLRPIK